MTRVTLTDKVRGGLTLLAVCLTLTSGPHVAGQARTVHALFNLSSPSAGPFPSDRFSVPDQNTRRRANLPLSACTAGDLPGNEVEKIVFSSTRDKPVPDPGTLAQVNLEIYIMNPDGTDPVRLTNNAVNDSFAALTPDRKGWMVFDSGRDAPPDSPPTSPTCT